MDVIPWIYRRPAWVGECCAGCGVLGPCDGVLPVCSTPLSGWARLSCTGWVVARQGGSAAAHLSVNWSWVINWGLRVALLLDLTLLNHSGSLQSWLMTWFLFSLLIRRWFFNGAKLWILKVKAQQGWPPSGNCSFSQGMCSWKFRKWPCLVFPVCFYSVRNRNKTAPKSEIKWCNWVSFALSSVLQERTVSPIKCTEPWIKMQYLGSM